MKNRTWYLYALAVTAVTLAALAVAQIGPPTSSARTSTQIVTAQNGIVQSTVSGNVEPGANLNVNFQTSGTLSNVYVKAGQNVTKGQRLATLDATSARLTLSQAEQNLTAAQDQLSTAQTNASSTTTSTATTPTTGGGSTGAASSASPSGSVASAQAAVYSAQASVNNATSALAATKLYAPISGTIVTLANLTPGDSVSAGSTSSASASTGSGNGSSSSSSGGNPGGTAAGSLGGSTSSPSSASSSSTSPFVQIVNTSTMTMTVAFSESDISKVKVGQAATVTLDALTGVELGAHVSAISPVGTTSSSVVSYSATLTLDQSDSRVKPGMSASASVIVSQAHGVTVPNSALTGSGSIATVTLVRNGKKTQQQVAVGLRGDTRTQIVSGLSAGGQLAVTTTLPPLASSTSTTPSAGGGTLGGTGVRPGGFGGGGGFGGSGAGGAGAGARGGPGAAGTGVTGAG
jgi:macrolide-specific efflux system membrane fusion protein